MRQWAQLPPIRGAVPLWKRPMHFSYTASSPLLSGSLILQAIRMQSINSLPSRHEQHLWLDNEIHRFRYLAWQVWQWHVQSLPILKDLPSDKLSGALLTVSQCECSYKQKKKRKSFLPVSCARPSSFDPIQKVQGREKLKVLGRQYIIIATYSSDMCKS